MVLMETTTPANSFSYAASLKPIRLWSNECGGYLYCQMKNTFLDFANEDEKKAKKGSRIRSESAGIVAHRAARFHTAPGAPGMQSNPMVHGPTVPLTPCGTQWHAASIPDTDCPGNYNYAANAQGEMRPRSKVKNMRLNRGFEHQRPLREGDARSSNSSSGYATEYEDGGDGGDGEIGYSLGAEYENRWADAQMAQFSWPITATQAPEFHPTQSPMGNHMGMVCPEYYFNSSQEEQDQDAPASPGGTKGQKGAVQPPTSGAWATAKRQDLSELGGVDESEATTLMIRGIPCSYSQERLMQFLDTHGLSGGYDFFYMPRAGQSLSNLGYAFVNFVDPTKAQMCSGCLDGVALDPSRSTKLCTTSAADIQGLENLRKHFRRTAVSRGSRGPVFLKVHSDLPSDAQASVPIEA